MARRSDPKQVGAAQLRVEILALRTLGLTLEQIGDKVGRSKGTVSKQLAKALDDLGEEQREGAQRLRALSFQRLERLLAKAMLLGAAGNLKAMREARSLIQAQARLMGFDAPIKHANTDPTGEHERLPPGTWTLPGRPDASIEEWQAEAERVWAAQQQRDATTPD